MVNQLPETQAERRTHQDCRLHRNWLDFKPSKILQRKHVYNRDYDLEGGDKVGIVELIN